MTMQRRIARNILQVSGFLWQLPRVLIETFIEKPLQNWLANWNQWLSVWSWRFSNGFDVPYSFNQLYPTLQPQESDSKPFGALAPKRMGTWSNFLLVLSKETFAFAVMILTPQAGQAGASLPNMRDMISGYSFRIVYTCIYYIIYIEWPVRFWNVAGAMDPQLACIKKQVMISYVMSKFASSTGNIPVTGLESHSLEDRCHTDVHIPQEYPTRDFGPTQNWAWD